jgi:hypothetical protein
MAEPDSCVLGALGPCAAVQSYNLPLTPGALARPHPTFGVPLWPSAPIEVEGGPCPTRPARGCGCVLLGSLEGVATSAGARPSTVPCSVPRYAQDSRRPPSAQAIRFRVLAAANSARRRRHGRRMPDASFNICSRICGDAATSASPPRFSRLARRSWPELGSGSRGLARLARGYSPAHLRGPAVDSVHSDRWCGGICVNGKAAALSACVRRLRGLAYWPGTGRRGHSRFPGVAAPPGSGSPPARKVGASRHVGAFLVFSFSSSSAKKNSTHAWLNDGAEARC